MPVHLVGVHGMAAAADQDGKLTTHILDTASGTPAAGVRIELFRLIRRERKRLAVVTTNADGRCEGPLVSGPDFVPGMYELLFHVGEYFRNREFELPTPAFLDEVPIRFGVAATAEHYHVPLLISPYGYSTYRGS